MEKTTNGRTKVELKLNEPVKLKLLKDRPYEGKSDFGLYLLYSVEENGVEKAYFAPPEVHQEIVKLECKGGDEIRLTKVAEENGKKGVAKILVESVARQVNTVNVLAPDNQHDDFKNIMARSLQDAAEITKAIAGVPFVNDDVQRIGTTLFIARTKSNHRP